MSLATRLKELEISPWHTAISSGISLLLSLAIAVITYLQIQPLGYSYFIDIIISFIVFYLVFQFVNVLVLLIDRVLLEIRRDL